MRKSTKLAVLVAALVALCAMSAFAYTKGWATLDGQWVYYTTTDGDLAYNEFRKSSDGNYYYLGDEGYMVTDQLVYDGGDTYYVDATGKRVVNAWVPVPSDEDEELDVTYRWYYFKSNGKAATAEDCTGTNNTKTINGKKYAFDTDGKMLFGFVANGEILTDESAVLDADMYFGSNEDGSAQTGWFESFADLNDAGEGDHNWFYFKTGKKYAGATKKIDGKTYEFKENGIMITGWSIVTTASGKVATGNFYGPVEDGSLRKKAWVWTVADKDDGADDPDSHWFWADGNGNYVYDTVRRINGKHYAFDKDGIMLAGLVKVAAGTEIKSLTENDVATFENANDDSKADYVDEMKNGSFDVYYFSGDEVNDGSLKTGTIKLALGDDEVTMFFDKSGKAISGLKNKKLYTYGILETAGEERYAVAENIAPADGEYNYYVVSTTGATLRDGGTAKTADDEWYAVCDGKIVLIKDKENASKAASAFAKGATEYGGYDFEVGGYWVKKAY